jgi:hypothetical protein
MNPSTRVDYDSPWKEVLERFFQEFIEFCVPAAYDEIDWHQSPEFLDKELQRVVRKSKAGRHTVDKLIKVWLKDGSEAWLLIHIEVQNQRDESFVQRMYVYSYRIFDRYGDGASTRPSHTSQTPGSASLEDGVGQRVVCARLQPRLCLGTLSFH